MITTEAQAINVQARRRANGKKGRALGDYELNILEETV